MTRVRPSPAPSPAATASSPSRSSPPTTVAPIFSADYRRAESLNPSFVSGKDAKGNFIAGFPAQSLKLTKGQPQPYAVDASVLALGQAKYQVYCAVCHGDAADGNGIMKVRSALEGDVAIVTIANLQTPIIRAYPNGQ
ncbi:MAG: hypothetical protein RL515_1411, partial [Verrucomicrobiota bacterium]